MHLVFQLQVRKICFQWSFQSAISQYCSAWYNGGDALIGTWIDLVFAEISAVVPCCWCACLFVDPLVFISQSRIIGFCWRYRSAIAQSCSPWYNGVDALIGTWIGLVVAEMSLSPCCCCARQIFFHFLLAWCTVRFSKPTAPIDPQIAGVVLLDIIELFKAFRSN